jgi:hypothetical protein
VNYTGDIRYDIKRRYLNSRALDPLRLGRQQLTGIMQIGLQKQQKRAANQSPCLGAIVIL